MKRLNSVKKEKTGKKRGAGKRKLVSVIIVFALILIIGAGYYFFGHRKPAERVPVLTEEQRLEITAKTNKLAEDFLRELSLLATDNTRSIKPFVLAESVSEVQSRSIPNDWVDYGGIRLDKIEVVDSQTAVITVSFPLSSLMAEKFMVIKYEVVKSQGQWLLSKVQSETIKDHGVTLWPVIQAYEEIVKTQNEVKNNREAWQLDPLQVVRKTAPLNGFSPGDQFELIGGIYNWVPNKGTYQAAVKAVHDGQAFYIVLNQPLRRGYWGIWMVDSISRNKPEFL